MASATSTPTLTPNDSRILNQVFDPESSPDVPTVTVDPELPSDPLVEPEVLSSCKDCEVDAIRIIESCGTDEKDAAYIKALSILNDLIERYPKYSSAYNNRAQLQRWRYGDRGTLVRLKSSPAIPEKSKAVSSALRDLDTCISLATPPSPKAPVSPNQGKLLAQAWTQRAAIFWSIAKDLKQEGLDYISEGALDSQSDWRSWDRMRFKEEGSRCFFMAGVYGSEVGKAMAVAANPYARLCGNIVKEAMRREGVAG